MEASCDVSDELKSPLLDTNKSNGARPKRTLEHNGASQLSPQDGDGDTLQSEVFKEEKIKKWKQAGTALRKVLSKITRSKSHKKNYARQHDSRTGKPAARSAKSHGHPKHAKKKSPHNKDVHRSGGKQLKPQTDPMNEMLDEFNEGVTNGVISPNLPPGNQSVIVEDSKCHGNSPARQLPSFADLKEKIRRMTSSSSNQEKINFTQKRTKVLRHSRSIDSSDKNASDGSSASEQDDFLPRKPHKSLHSHKEKRKSIDNATLSSLHNDLQVDIGWSSKSMIGAIPKTQEPLPDLVSDSSSSDSEMPNLCRWKMREASKSGSLRSAAAAGHSSQPSDDLTSKAEHAGLHQTESVANLADVESCASDGEVCGVVSDSDALMINIPSLPVIGFDRDHTPTQDGSDSDVSVPTLCSDSSTEERVASQILKEKYTPENSREQYPCSWPLDDADDDSDLSDDLPDLALHLDHMSSSEGEVSPVLRLTRSDMEALPDLLSESSSSSEAEGADADDEFECDCPLCMHNRNGRSRDGVRSQRETAEDYPSLVTDSDLDESQVREFASMLLSEGRDSVLELMFQNVIIQMLSVYPDLLNDQAPPPISPTSLDSLPTRTILARDIEEDLTCPICLCAFEVEEEAVVLACSHIFHTLCIRAWLAKSGTCPVCRFSLRNSTS